MIRQFNIRLNADTPRSLLIMQFTGFPEHIAVVDDDIDALDAALAEPDGDCDVEHLDGVTPLVLAIRLHRTRMVERLLFLGAKVDSKAAAVAAQFGNERMMALLIQAGVNPNLRVDGRFSDTLCHFAARNTDAGALRVLIAAGAKFDMPDRLFQSSLILYAAQNENEEILSICLAAGCDLKSDGADKDMVAAAGNRNHKVLALLIDAGFNVDEMNVFGFSAIHLAARNPNVAVVRLLIDAGVDVNRLDSKGESPLFNACINSNMEVLDALLAAGAEWCDVAKDRSICHAAAANSNEDIVRRVIERCVDVNARDSKGLTPLMIAARSNTSAVVSILLEAGADVHAVDSNQKNVCDHACANEKNRGIMRVLIDAGAAVGAHLLTPAISSSNIDAIHALIDTGMSVAREINANPALIFDVHLSSPQMLEVLFGVGVDFRLNFGNGNNLYHRACRLPLYGWAPVLFAHGANLDIKDDQGKTPTSLSHTWDVVVTLIAAGFDCSQRRDFHKFRGCFLAAVGHPGIAVDSVPRRQLAWACHAIAERQFDLLRLRAFQVCVGLQALRFPALVSCEILAHAFAPLESLVAFHRVWAVVTKIRHFQSGSK